MDFDGTPRQVSGWTDGILADLTIDFIERQAETKTPWYVITAYISPHGPWICDPKFSDPLEGKGYSRSLATLYGMVEQMDAATGRIRVPFAIRWPGKIAPGNRSQLGAIEDILPTLLDLADVSDVLVSGHLPFDERSLRSVLTDAGSPDEDRVYFRLPIAGKGMPLPTEQDHIGIIEDPTALDYENIHAVLYGTRFKFHHLPGGGQEVYDIKTTQPATIKEIRFDRLNEDT